MKEAEVATVLSLGLFDPLNNFIAKFPDDPLHREAPQLSCDLPSKFFVSALEGTLSNHVSQSCGPAQNRVKVCFENCIASLNPLANAAFRAEALKDVSTDIEQLARMTVGKEGGIG